MTGSATATGLSLTVEKQETCLCLSSGSSAAGRGESKQGGIICNSLCSVLRLQLSAVDVDQRLFQPFPSEVVFENYVPQQFYIAALALRNTDRVPRLLNVILGNSPYFELISPSDEDYKVAPGMSSTYRILFRPDENKDYFDELIIITEREKFFVPIRAIGARASLDFPEQLNFSNCPVRFSTQKTLLVRNVGNREACYSITTLSPFSVDPSIGTLGVGEAMQVTVEFHPPKTGVYSSPMIVHYDTGEDVHKSLCGRAVNVNIRLDKSSLTVEKTSVTLSNQRCVVIHNQSAITAHFQWKRSVDQEEEERQKLRFCHPLQRQEEDKLVDVPKEHGVVRPLGEQPSLPICTSQNQGTEVQGDSVPFCNDIFTIVPMEGDILPNSSLEISVIFKPKEAGVYQETVYCDISGCESRLPLCISGEGVGPQVELSCEQLSIGEVSVGSSHSYRVILLNRGVLEAPFGVVYAERALGSCFTFAPREGVLLPFEHQVIWISFNATVLGQFTEEFQFRVKGSPEPLTLTVSGCVIGPAFHFNVSSLSFGEVSFGFPRTLCCRLTNTSPVPFNFNLRIPGDGSGAPSVTSFAQVSDSTGPSWRKPARGAKKPAEFTIRPLTGTVCSKGHLDIQVTLCSNTVKRYKLALVVDVDGVGREVLSLPIRARCGIPLLRVLHPAVTFGRCSLKVPYQQMLTLVNDSNLPGCYWALPQENKDAAAVWYSSPEPRGIIQPHSSVEIPFTLEVQVTGEQDTVAHVVVFGSKESPLKIHLLSTGEGPVVHVHPSEINFGCIQVLQDASRSLHLCNQSVIPASFSAKMAGENAWWSIGPSQGVIPAKAEVSVVVTANLDDTEQFKDEVVLFIENSHACVIPVQAVGVGTTIVVDKPFGPELKLGPCFSLDPCCYRFKMTNKGQRTHLLYWTTEGGTTLEQRKHLPPVRNTKGKVSSCGPVFKLQPLRTELMPGQTAEMVLEGSCSTPQVVKEKLLCHAIVGKEGVKNLIMQVDVTCEFIAPALQISSREIPFRVEKHPSDVLTLQYKPLSLKNICCLPLTVVLALEQPFSICGADQQPLPADAQPTKLRRGEELQLCIAFNPAYEEDLLIRAAEKALKIRFLEHPHEEQVTVRGEVYFPNLQLQTTALDFGCILNDTKDVRYMEMSNCSPLVVQYHWSFLKDSQVNPVRFLETEPLALGVEEVFDILPLHGELQPGQSQRVTFSFFGHANTVTQVTALCRVEGGPSYEVALRGEASRISYLLDTTEIDCGLQVFNKVTEAAVTLQNSGKLGFAFVVLSPGTGTAASPLPGVPLVVPSTGYAEPGKQQVLKVYYLPGVPGVFCRAFQIQVGHLEPEKITLKGEGTFPRIHLDLPRNIKGNAKYEKILQKAKEKVDKGRQREEAIALGEAVAGEPRMDDSGTVWDAELQMQMEEMLIEEHALEQQKALTSRPAEDTAFHQRVHRRLLKAELPEYVLDLGYVVPGDIHTRIVKVTNTGHFPASFHVDGYVLDNTGFSVCLDRVKRLPSCESKTFEVCFDPQSASRPLGKVDVLLPIKVRGGPTSQVRLRAIVAEPSLSLSRDRLEFSAVQCGQCQEETIQLHNTFQVPCQWSISVNEPVKEVKRRQGVTRSFSGGLSLPLLPFLPLWLPEHLGCSWLEGAFEGTEQGWFTWVNKHLPASEHQKLLEEMKSAPCGFEVLPSAGTLAPGQQCHVQVRFSPTEEKCYRGELHIQICQSSQRLQVPVLGRGLEPRLEFSPAELELGPLLPQSHGEEGTVVVKTPCEVYSLEFDQQRLAEEQLLRTPQGDNSHNSLLLPPCAPAGKLTGEAQGRGIKVKVDVVDPPGKVVKLGNVCIGQTVKKIVTIANKSAAPLAFQLRVTSTAPELQEAGVLCLKPSKELKLKPRGDRGKVEVTFSPKRPIQPFSGEVLLECGGLARSLFVVRGSCQGSLVSLDQEQLSFGAVVQQSYTWRRVVMRNAGVTGVRFTWDVESFKPDFSISPTKGYISPGRDVPFVVTFRPSKLSQAVQYEGLRCFIQGSEALRLTLSGSCVEAPGPKETLTFSCSVRERQSQTILLSNPSNEAWTLQPIIEGKYWKGPEFIHLEARQKEKAYQVTYRPLSMSSENKKHQGSIFFPLPDGTGLRYHLEGTAEAPRCSGAISRQVPCRSSHTELIPVSNWLHSPQRLLVVIDMLKPENVESSSVLQGCSYIDVPSSAKKDYQLTFFSYKEGVFRAKVTFLNETTGEYLFHVVTFKVTASGPIGTVKMSTAVRQRVSSTVKVDNPLPVPVTFDVTCEVPDVSAPQHFTVPAQSKADLVLEYQPLKTGESTGHLVLQSSDLGSLSYNLQLKAISQRPEKPVYFRATLGSRQTITTKIRNFAQQKTEYLLQTDCADFQTAKSISAAPAGAGGSDLSVEVTFEPCQLGEAKATLQLSSALGGQYRIPLIGLALPPEAQGPFLIPAGGSTSISFRNVFPKATAFQYAVKHPAFTVRAPEMLRAKSSTTITVSFRGGRAPVTSRLVVSCPGGSWIYHLRGLPSTLK
ncbi:hydrocephalus-inducing protein-like [Pezoporus flaviventris]|uniref:hydrocephalus-inducing protein-like n=1 Tax=Pezoporus flaviventris TaxID=889875 RepID=UPI002AAF2F09|nr:hydrocephalus-inducing protein-like [Pezoporus flaviventris]